MSNADTGSGLLHQKTSGYGVMRVIKDEMVTYPRFEMSDMCSALIKSPMMFCVSDNEIP